VYVNNKFLFWWSFFTLSLYPQKNPWTWHYRYVCPVQQVHAAAQKSCQFAQVGTPTFTQLICSWNAVRPKQGYYSFYVRVHSRKKNAWTAWHKMADWGTGVQKSYESLFDGVCRYVYVRLEIDPADKVDGFSIKAVAHNADITGVHGFGVNISDHNKFVDERMVKNVYNSVCLSGVPQKSQLTLEHEKKRMMCSPTSCSMLCEYLSGKSVNPLQFAQHAYDYGLRVYGSWPFNMAQAFNAVEGKYWFYTMRLHSFKSLYDRLKQNIPVAVSVRGEIPGAPKEYKEGHLLLVVGYNAENNAIICHDPAALTDMQTVREYPIDSFLKAWGRSRRLSYIAMPM
jgi:hypothetical protein